MTDLLSPVPFSSIDEVSRSTESGYRCAAGDSVARILDPSVNQLFSVTLRLAAMASSQTDARVANRLLGAVQEIDDAIHQLREDLIAELVAVRAACDTEHASW